MSTIDVTDICQFKPLVINSIEMIGSSTEGLSCQDVLEKMSQKEENHKLSTPKIKKSDVRSMHKHQYMNEQGGVIIIKGAGVSLHIPPDALRERTFISIEVKSAANCDTTGLDPSTILTPIVSCQPDGLRFEKAVELILPHCAEFDDIHLHKATARFVGGVVSVSTDSTEKQDQVRCVLKERYCHVYTTHFSDVVVGISNCVKKRMLIVPFSGGSTKLCVKVWITNDLPSEYAILLHDQKELNFAPFNHNGKFIFENHGQCSLKVQSSLEDRILTEVSKVIHIQELFRNIRSEHDFEIEKKVTDTSPKFITVSLLKDPVFDLQKEIQDGDRVESVQEEVCAFEESETQYGEVAQTHTESDDVVQQIFTYQTDIFKAIIELLTDVSKDIWDKGFRYRRLADTSDIFTKVTSLQPAIFKKISSLSEDIFWKLSPGERELIKAVSSFNTDILERVSTAQTVFQKEYLQKLSSVQTGANKTFIVLHTEIFERISTFIEDILEMPPLMQKDLFHQVKTLELAIFERIEALQKDLDISHYYFFEDLIWNEYLRDIPAKMATFATDSFQRMLSFHEDFLRLSPMAPNDIAIKVTAFVQDLLLGTSSFVKDLAQVLSPTPEDPFFRQGVLRNPGLTTMINAVHRGVLKDISTFVKGFQDSVPSFGEDLFKLMSSLENDFLKLMSSLEKESLQKWLHFKEDSDESSSYSSKETSKNPIKLSTELRKSWPYLKEDFLTKPLKFGTEPRKSWSYFKKDSHESSSYSSKDPLTKPFKSSNGGEEESSKPPESKTATAN